MIIKYIQSILRVMPLFIDSLSCSFDPERGVVIVEDKTVHVENDQHYLVHNVQGRKIKLLIEEAFIPWECLKQCYPDSKDNKKALLQSFINDFHDPELKLKVKYIAAEAGHGFAITLCAREQVKDENGNRVLCNNYVSRQMTGKPLVNQDGKECYGGALVFKKYIELNKLDIVGYGMCLIDESKPDVMIGLCKHYRDLIQEHAIDETKKDLWNNIMKDIIDAIRMIDLPLDSFRAPNLPLNGFGPQGLLFAQRAQNEGINSLNTLGSTIREALNNMRPFVLEMRQLHDLLYDRQVSDDEIRQHLANVMMYIREHSIINYTGETLLTDNEINNLTECERSCYLMKVVRYILNFEELIDDRFREIIQLIHDDDRRGASWHMGKKLQRDICSTLIFNCENYKIEDYALTAAFGLYMFASSTEESFQTWVEYLNSWNPRHLDLYLDNE